jgi:hypothetical protein
MRLSGSNLAKAPTDAELDPDIRDLIAELRHLENALSLRIADETARKDFKRSVRAFSNKLRRMPIEPRPRPRGTLVGLNEPVAEQLAWQRVREQLADPPTDAGAAREHLWERGSYWFHRIRSRLRATQR